MKKSLAVVILAAGKGKRMKNPDLPKVLVPLTGKPLLGHVLDKVSPLEPSKTVIVIGHLKEKVIDYVNGLGRDNMSFAVQSEQLGTGHAVDMAREELADFDGNVLILAGDVPLLTSKTLMAFSQNHDETGSDCSVLSTTAPDPTGYGRIIRDGEGNFLRITEHKDASEEEREVDEINSGIFCVDCKKLFDSLAKVDNKNAQGEYYLTDIIDILRGENAVVTAWNGADFDELQGVNNVDDLKRAEEAYNKLNK
jgi:UDP-N-acetylglucosamine diphosphorylase/glucosamine-1-phosphate N-acetyltransferase